MKTETILNAIDALDEARRVLRCGGSVAEQMVAGDFCSKSSTILRRELLADVPEVPVTPQQVDPLAWSKAAGVEEF